MKMVAPLILLGALAPTAALAQARPCESLISLSLPDTTITMAQTVTAGALTVSSNFGTDAWADLPAFCRVAATLTPSSDSNIRIEVWIPVSGWHGRFQAVGAGGLAGRIPYRLMARALTAGYATAGTDTGHVGNNADFMPEHPEKLVDFAYRANHEMAVAAKSVISSYYGKPPTRSYYNGCSGGGRHGLTSAQRYPGDFDGIVVGASSWDQARLDAVRIGINLTVNRTPESRIPTSKYPMIHEAVLEACDGSDGLRDGVIGNPRQCNFDYAILLCGGGDGASCLTAPQVESARVLTSPFRDRTTNNVLFEAHLWPGTELGWGRLGGPKPLVNSMARVRNFHLKDPNWEPHLDNVAEDIERATTMDGGLLASNNLNLKPFFDRGGKLLMWHGWDDPQVPAQNSIIFYEGVWNTVGREAEDSIALFLLPGVAHCRGGPGADTFDVMAGIEQWVEQGEEPLRISASHSTDGRIDRTRPLCPYGEVAEYVGSGSTDDEANFACKPEATTGR